MDKKGLAKENNKQSNSSPVVRAVVLGTLFALPFTVFATFSYFQYRSTSELRRRIEVLELEIWSNKLLSKSANANSQSGKSKRDVSSFLELYEEIADKQLEVLESRCKSSSVLCLPGRRGLAGFHGRYARQAADQCCRSLSKPMISGPPTDSITVVQGQNIILPCQTSASPPADIVWVPGIDPKRGGRYVETPNGLEVSNAQYVDNGMFECKASNVFGTTVKHVKLNVIEHLKVDLTPDTSTITTGTDPYMDYICTYKGVPQPQVIWLHVRPDGVYENITAQAQTLQGRSTLHIDNPNALDGGQYICEVKNEFEQKSDIGNVTVYSKPEIVSGPKTLVAKIGETINLKCDVVGIPKATIQWYFPKTGTSVPKDVTINPDNSITVNHVDKFSEGTYTCEATNSFGSSTSNGALTVVVPLVVSTEPKEKPLRPGENYIQLMCKGSGNPPPTLSWSKKGDPSAITGNPGKFLPLQNGALVITSVDMDKDSGVYMCNGSNGQETGGDSTILYKDLGNMTCSTRFADCSTRVGVACGGRCPGNCEASAGAIYGYKEYSIASNVCLAGKHTGIIRNPGDIMLWTVENGGNSLESKLSNGIQSEYSGPLAIQANIYFQQINLGQLGTVNPIAPLGN
ncbi:hypothetical protein FSP39_004806 [Pinctada imbricata]|uniref:Uncharacterized protein n=1 Tax=Pinctada imbricata TaxID=66713 RepID=A0AA88Y5G2_PINIB|nr:hypothetical protein FSP39_004806 [Pinctada imbricata]